jgi:predicted DNA-binding transcriptional regulator AlpA
MKLRDHNQQQVVTPRGLSRTEAAFYIGVSPTLFDQLVADGRMPQPKRINSRKVWDRLKIDQRFAALPGDDDGDDQDWKVVL